MSYRSLVELGIIALLILFIVMTVHPEGIVIISILHLLCSAFIYILLSMMKVKKNLSFGMAAIFYLISLLFVLKLLSLFNILLLLAIVFVGFAYMHTK